MTVVLVDADIVAFRVAASAENEEFDIALARTRDLMNRIVTATNAEDYEAYLSGSDNFRYKLFPEYKSNRSKERPKHLEPLKEFLVTEWSAKVTYGYEADDGLSIKATELTRKEIPYVIASIDKDLKQIPGNHYNFVTNFFDVVSEEQGLKNFYKGLLIGDTADFIKGVTGIGKVKAERAIGPLNTERDMFDLVRAFYNDDKRLLLNGQLMWLLREEEKYWPFGQQLAETASSSVL